MSPPSRAAWLLDLADFFGGPEAAAEALTQLATLSRWPASAAAFTPRFFDSASLAAMRRALAAGGVLAPDGQIVQKAAGLAAAEVRLAVAAVAEAERRRPHLPSRLVVTATCAAELADLPGVLGVPSLYELIERTVRLAHHTVTLGAPFWNAPALAALRPALDGALERGCALDLVLQGGQREPTAAHGALARFADGLRVHGTRVTVWEFDADALAERHIRLHAKFALADTTAGYLGSANLTDQGFTVNFEIGAELGPAEVAQLHSLLERLRRADVLRPA
jgi:phosphatidylserine/phosphatidylglycerophosphate/cardiolipin synthase-like enzyme